MEVRRRMGVTKNMDWMAWTSLFGETTWKKVWQDIILELAR